MTSYRDLGLEQKVHLIREKERGLSHPELKDKLQVSLGTVSNILKRKYGYLADYESNQNNRFKRKLKDELGQTINDAVYDWFVAQRSKKSPVSGPILPEYATKVATKMNNTSDFKARNVWLERFLARHIIQFRVTSGDGVVVNGEMIEDWKGRLSKIIESYHRVDTCDFNDTSLFLKLKPDRSLVLDKKDCKGEKKAKDRYTVLLGAS